MTKKKINRKAIAALKGNRGPTGPTGPTGPSGPMGPQGLLGPTSADTAGSVEAQSSSGFAPFGAAGTVTLPAAGKVFVEVSGFYLIACNAAGPCSAIVSAFVDGAAVPGAHQVLNAAANTEDAENVAVSGLALDVPAGTHTVQLEVRLSANVQNTNSENFHLAAAGLGNS